MRFYRISRAVQSAPEIAFSGLGAAKAAHRWNWPSPKLRAVYCSETLALACLETLVHIRPLPRNFPPSVFYTVELPEEQCERPQPASLPAGWDAVVPSSAARDFGGAFLKEQRAVALIVPTAIVPIGLNAIVNPQHPNFRLSWVRGPHPFRYDGRLE